MRKVTFVRNRTTTGGIPTGTGYRVKSLSELTSLSVPQGGDNIREVEVGDGISLEEIKSWKSYNTSIDVVMVEK